MMKMKAIAEASMWLPGFAPDENPIELRTIGQQREADVIPFPERMAATSTKSVWPRLEASIFAGLSGEVSKYEANIAAIELLRKLESEERQPTGVERDILNRYTGWGGLPQAFNLEQKDHAWVERSERLKALLSAEEYESARLSTPNAHYTSYEVIDAMWAMVERLGFKGGRILEPAAGVGYFIGAMPEHLARESVVTAIELDSLSARIAKSLYAPFGVHVYNMGFEAMNIPEGFFDLAISNVPFGNYQVPEHRNVPYAGFSIHNYFFAKALEVVRPGGLVAFITSSFTLDAADTRVRAYLASKADLVAAIRLPNTAFKKIANTEVTTDIVILQKPLSQRATKANGWLESVYLDDSSPIYGGFSSYYRRDSIRCNQWFAENPQWVIGKIELCDNGYGKSTGCTFDGDIVDELKERIGWLPEGIYTSREEDAERHHGVKLSLTEQHRPGFRVIDGLVYEINGSEAVLYKAPQKTLDRIAGLVEVRDAARKLIKAQAETEDEALLARYRLELNASYDRFIAKYGFIHAKANRQAFKGDPDLPMLLSLERWDEESKTAEKADIFHRRTVGVIKRVERCDTPQEALITCVAENGGRVIESRIGELLGKPGEEAMKELEAVGAVFLDPETGNWETADAYLSGNVRHKLMVARLAGERFSGNVKALEAVIPPDMAPHEIGARIGSTWIPTVYYEQFLNELLA